MREQVKSVTPLDAMTYAQLAQRWVDAEDEDDDLTCMVIDDELNRRGGKYEQHAVRRLFWEACCQYAKRGRDAR